MQYYQYDKTFEGLLTAVFDAFFRKESPEKIVGEGTHIPLFTDIYEVVSDEEKAERVLNGLKPKLSKSAIQMLSVCFLHETDEASTHIFHYICKAFRAPVSIELNFADADVLELSKMYKKIQREEEKIRQFVRFQKTADGIFFACIEPLFNILPLSADFFQDRFADQQWIIYDMKRNYGLYYDLQKTDIVQFETPPVSLDTGQLSPEQMDAYEQDFQKLWRQYFKSAAIKERTNLKLQRQHMPRRFWKYLTEKMVLVLALFLVVFWGCTSKSQTASIASVVINTDILQEGDLVFRRGHGMESEVVIALDKIGAYSHIGIVVKDSVKGWQIVHAVPGEQESAKDPDYVKMEDISLFFRKDRAICGAIMRLKGEAQKCKNASLRAQQLCNQQVLFDHSYNIEDTTKMYCTELIDFVFRKENLFLYKEVIDKKYLLPGDIQVNKDIEVILQF